MAGLSANVTLGPGVVPIPGQINVPAGPDEMSFGDAFAEAQATRLDAMDARDAASRQVSSTVASGPVPYAPEPPSRSATVEPPASPIWPRSGVSGPSRADWSDKERPAEASGSAGIAASGAASAIRDGSKASSKSARLKTESSRSTRRTGAATQASGSSKTDATSADATSDPAVGAALTNASVQTDSAAVTAGNDGSATRAVDATAAVGAAGAAGATAAGTASAAAATTQVAPPVAATAAAPATTAFRHDCPGRQLRSRWFSPGPSPRARQR